MAVMANVQGASKGLDGEVGISPHSLIFCSRGSGRKVFPLHIISRII